MIISDPRTWKKSFVDKVLHYLDYRTKLSLLRVSKGWKEVTNRYMLSLKFPVWFYVVFRRQASMTHEKLMVQTSDQGPLFWEREMFFVTCCSCHFSQNHLVQLMGMCRYLAHRIQRLCMVDSSVKSPFIPDRFFDFAIKCFPKMEFLYLRELSLEYLNYKTATKMADHKKLIRIIVHNCKAMEVLKEFHVLPQLLIVEGEIANNRLGKSLEDLDLASSFHFENRKAIFLSSRKGAYVTASKSAEDLI